MIIGILSSFAITASAPAGIDGYDPQKHLDATFYSCSTYARKNFGASDNSNHENEFSSQQLGILVWFELDGEAEKARFGDIRWKHAVTAPSNIYNDSDASSSFRNIRDVNWEISTLSDGHITGSTHWDKIIYYYKPTDQPHALLSVVQEERRSSDNGIADIALERVYHAYCHLYDDQNAFKLYNEFAQ